MHQAKLIFFILTVFFVFGASLPSYADPYSYPVNANEKSLAEQNLCMDTVIPKMFGDAIKEKNALALQEDLPAIGVLLPLSGKWSTVGQQLLKGLQLAGNVFGDGKTPRICYVIEDYGEDEAKIPSLIKGMDERSRVIAIIGPVGESASKLAYDAAQARGIPIISFTQADFPPVQNTYCFRNFMSTSMQVNNLLKAAKDLGIKRFAILYPKDHFGTVFTSSFTTTAKKYGISVVRSVDYSPGKTEFKDEVKKLLTKSTSSQATDSGAWFDALLVPDTAMNAAIIASYLSYNNVTGVRLFGPSSWDPKELINVGGKNVEDSVFVSGFFDQSWREPLQNFIGAFSYTFGYSPSIWEASAYDTANILQDLIQNGASTRSALKEKIASLRNYPGATGNTSFFSDGTVDKELFILTIKDSRIVELPLN